MIAGKRRTPLSQYSYQCASGEVILNLIDWKRRKAMAGAYSLADQAGRVEGELALDPHIDFTPVFFELPGVEASCRGQAQVYAIVADEFLRSPGDTMGFYPGLFTKAVGVARAHERA